ncbi:MAG: hypothetical protein EOM23_01425 [Candidatus Moranbacteria bacterium]|nr:hypothetical protein [Candidatus Moranbacteria bacterium]
MNNQTKLKDIAGWSIIFITLFSAWLIYYFEQFNIFFLALLVFEMALAVRYRKVFTPAMLRTSQIIIALLFLFSGFVKAVDPLGTAYRIEDYLGVYGIAHDFWMAVALSFMLNAVELLLGGLFLFNIKPKISAWLIAFMMAVFTATTLYDALYDPVPDCGCFGDAVIMTNWQTFYKNLAINVFVLISVFGRSRLKSKMKNITEWSLALGMKMLFIGYQYINYVNLPMIDFRAYKVGNRLTPENPLPVKNYLTYRNMQTGETQEFLSPNYPFNDSEWLANWEFVSHRVDDPNVIKGVDLAIIDFYGDDLTKYVFQDTYFHFIVVAWDLSSTNRAAFQKINELYLRAENEGMHFIVLTTTLQENIDQFIVDNEISYDLQFHYADGIELKTMIRSNPGLFLIHDGLILDKWHYNRLPEWDFLEQKYFHNRD